VITFGRDDEDPRHMPPDRRLQIDPQRDRARLSVLAEVSLLLASSDDYVTILQSLTAMAVPTLGDWCSVHMVGSTGQLERIAIRHVDPARLEMAELLAKNAGRSNTGGRGAIDDDPNARGAARVFASGKSEWAERVGDELLAEHAREPWARDALRFLGIASYIAVPLIVRARVIGVFTLVRDDSSEAYDRDDLAFAEELARRVAMYVDNAMLLREVQMREAALRDEATRLETLNRIGQELAAIHDLDEVVKRVCDAATALTGAEIGLYFTYADGEAKYALCGTSFEEAEAIAARRGELTPSSSAFALQRALRMDDVRRAAAATNLGVLSGIERIHSYLAVPVRGRTGELIGGIALAHSRAAAFDARAEQLVIGLASLTATATDSARLFREQNELIAALEKSNHDLDKFAYVTSHDLRAPLRGIANLSQWMEEDLGDKLTDKSREFLHLLRGRVRRLEDLIQGVLDYSRAGRVSDAPTEVDVGALVRECVELVAPLKTAQIEIAPHLPTLCTTRVPLQQVFMNLIGNALKYNPKPEPRVQIGAEPTGNGWEFYVRDDGPGIAARYHAQIWGMFQTLHSRDRIESTGMGLAIVRKIVEAHGGRAWIDSEEGKGSTLRFTWPKDPPRSRSWDRHMRKR
jgi:signal transduction histidine kinase